MKPNDWVFNVIDPATFKAPERVVNNIFVHCSASDAKWLIGPTLAQEVNNWHLANGWAGVGYHFLIDKDGNLMNGRSLELGSAAQLGPNGDKNHDAIAIMVHGNWDFTPKSLETLITICKVIDAEYHRIKKPVTFHGHCEVDPKPCPVFDYKRLLGLDAVGNLFGSTDVLSPDAVSQAIASKHQGG